MEMADDFKVVEGNFHKLIDLIREDHLILVFFFVIPAALVIIIEVTALVLNRISQREDEQERIDRAVAKARKEARNEAREEFEAELKRIKAEYEWR